MQGNPTLPGASLNGVQAKLERARTHQNAVQLEIQAFLDRLRSELNPLVAELDPETGEKRWRVDRDLPAPPTTLSPLIGDALYNFRSALDHLVWQLVIANGAVPTPGNAFLICDDRHKFASGAPNRLRGVAPRAVALIKDFQPCHTQHHYWGPSLWHLETLGNVDKHRHFNLLTAATAGGFWNPVLPVGASDVVFIAEGPVERGTVVASVPERYAYVDFSFVPDVAFDEAPAPADDSVDGVLMGIDSIVAHIVDELGKLI